MCLKLPKVQLFRPNDQANDANLNINSESGFSRMFSQQKQAHKELFVLFFSESRMIWPFCWQEKKRKQKSLRILS